MAGYYPSHCDSSIPPHSCDPCAGREYGRIRSGAYIHKDYYPTLVADAENPQKWMDGINQGLILVIPETNGELAEPSELTTAGYGDALESVLGYDFSATFRDPNYKENCDFWNAIKNRRNYHLAYRTSSSVHLTDKPVTIIPKAPIADDLMAEVVWVVLNKWRSNEHPCATATPAGIFVCMEEDFTAPPLTPCGPPSNILYADQLTSLVYDVVAGTKLVVPLGFVYSLHVMDLIVHECAVLEVFGSVIIDTVDLENYGTVIVHDSGGVYVNGGNYQGNGGSLSGSISIN